MFSLGVAEAKEPMRIAFLPFVNGTGDVQYDELANAFGQAITSYLSKESNIVVVEREDLLSVITEKGRGEGEAIATHGKVLSANVLVSGVILYVGGKFVVSIQLLETETSLVIAAIKEHAIMNEWQETAHKIAKRIEGIEFVAHDNVHTFSSHGVKINLYFMQGVGAFYSNQFDNAVIEFMRVLSLKEDHDLAQFWLAKSYLEGGFFEESLIEYVLFLKKFPNHAYTENVQKSISLINQNLTRNKAYKR